MSRHIASAAVLALFALTLLALALATGCEPVAGTGGNGDTNNNGGTGGDNGGTGGDDGGDTTGGTVEVDIGPGSVFAPQAVTARRGDTVRWTSRTTSAHTVTSDTPAFDSDGEFPTGLRSGDVFEWVVPTDIAVGTTIFYNCRFHATPGDGTELGTGMVGSVTIIE